MMDILLTKNEAYKAISRGMADWDVAGRPLHQSMWYEQRALCCAQLLKVDMELFAPWEQKLTAQIDAEGYVEHQVRLDVALRTVQAARTALREAAGEGK
jgi:hypothetical protein